MPADSSIYSQIKPIEQPNMLAQLAAVSGLQEGQFKLAGLARDEQRRNRLEEALAGGADSNALMRGGFLDESIKLDKAGRENRKTDAEAGEKKAQMNAHHIKLMGDLTNTIAADPRPETVAAVLDQWEGLTGLKAVPTRQAFAQAQSPEAIRDLALRLNLTAKDQLPKTDTVNIGGQTLSRSIDTVTGKPTTTATYENTQTKDNAATTGLGYAKLGEDKRHNTTMEGYRGTEVGQGRTQVVVDPNQGPLVINKVTGATTRATMDGKPVPSENQTKLQTGARKALDVIKEAESLIGDATGSYLGTGVDLAGRAVGYATDGAEATAKLKALEGALMMSQPRMEGPQSNLDVSLYRQMAGQIGDPTVPRSQKQAALSTIKKLNEKWGGPDAATPASPVSPGTFSDAGKESRYQAWKRSQGIK